MTERLYYDNSLLFSFDGEVTQMKEENGHKLLALNRSAFYPTSGGQPFDTGKLTLPDGKIIRVVDVNVDEKGEVWHTVDGWIDIGTKVRGDIDKERRLDHMEQHGGEHMLAGAIWHQLKGVTIGLHTGEKDATIDVTLPGGRTHMTEEEIKNLEDEVNGHIRDCVPVKCFFPTPEELEKLPLRKPPTVKENIRVVAFGDFEYCACGGTHPPFSGMIGMMKILSVTPARGKARVSFVCGRRAFEHMQKCQKALEEAGSLLSCGLYDVPQAVEQSQKKYQEKELEKQEMARLVADQFVKKAKEQEETIGENKIQLLRLPGGDRKLLIQCAGEMIGDENVIAFTCVPDEKGGFSVVFACGNKVNQDMSRLMKESGIRGGGKKNFAQGSAANGEILLSAKENLIKML